MGFEKLDDQADMEPYHCERPISNIMLYIWQSRKDLQDAFDLRTPAGHIAFVEWYEKHADTGEYPCDPPLSNLMLLIWQHRKDLQDMFDLRSIAGRIAYAEWYEDHANSEYGITSADITQANTNQISPNYSRWKDLNAWLLRASRLRPRVVRQIVKHVFFRQIYKGETGVNLIGYAHAELGMGEHVRMSAASLSETDVPFGVMDIGAGGTTSRQKATLDRGSLIDSNKYKVSIFHVAPNQILPVYLQLGREYFQRRYNIVYPFWELSKFPREWIWPMQLLDEVWAPTTFIQKALTDALGTAVPYMPVGVALPALPKLGRGHFDIPGDQYLFFFSFDFYSFIDRKNPYAVIAAFKRAFPIGNEKAGLIMKVMNANESNENWQRLVSEVGGDKRIRLINKVMSKVELLSFKSECDCYISLHRSEGLGLGPLEAMLLGKPVIITNYSGNTDYAKTDNSCLVNYSLIPVQKGQYIFHENQVWADPDVEHAASHMKRLMNDPELGISLGKKAAAFVTKNYNPARCGQLYKLRLQELGLINSVDKLLAAQRK